MTSPFFYFQNIKKADFLIKIENIDYGFDADEIIDTILKIKNVTTAYSVDTTNLKSKNNLIF
ncbi:MAG: IPExxxVDY family protein [Flavobacterium sp.]|nr:IPExxxVDY family protein [Flavobacterium sp.]